YPVDGVRVARPVFEFLGQLLSAGPGEGINLGHAAVLGLLPLAAHKPLALESMQCRVERALLNIENLPRGYEDSLGDPVAVQGSWGQHFQYEKVEGALEEFGFLGSHSLERLLTLNLFICRMSRP